MKIEGGIKKISLLFFIFKKVEIAISLYLPIFYVEQGGNGSQIEVTIKQKYAPIM